MTGVPEARAFAGGVFWVERKNPGVWPRFRQLARALVQDLGELSAARSDLGIGVIYESQAGFCCGKALPWAVFDGSYQ